MHLSRMRTDRALTVFSFIIPISLKNGRPPNQTPTHPPLWPDTPQLWTEWHTSVKTLPSPILLMQSVKIAGFQSFPQWCVSHRRGGTNLLFYRKFNENVKQYSILNLGDSEPKINFILSTKISVTINKMCISTLFYYIVTSHKYHYGEMVGKIFKYLKAKNIKNWKINTEIIIESLI